MVQALSQVNVCHKHTAKQRSKHSMLQSRIEFRPFPANVSFSETSKTTSYFGKLRFSSGWFCPVLTYIHRDFKRQNAAGNLIPHQVSRRS